MATGHFENADYDVLAPKIVTELSHESLYKKSEVINLFRDFTADLRAAGCGRSIKIPYVKSDQIIAENLNVTDCDINNVCQKFDISEAELQANLSAYICWELQRCVYKSASAEYKAAILREAISAGNKKFDNDLFTAILGAGAINSLTPADATKVSLEDLLQARKFIKDTAKLEHNRNVSYLVGRAEMFNQITRLKDFNSCCGTPESPVTGLVGGIVDFSFIEVSNDTLPENTLLVINKASGAFGLGDAEFRPDQRLPKKTCYLNEWLQEYGFLLFEDGAKIAKLEYTL